MTEHEEPAPKAFVTVGAIDGGLRPYQSIALAALLAQPQRSMSFAELLHERPVEVHDSIPLGMLRQRTVDVSTPNPEGDAFMLIWGRSPALGPEAPTFSIDWFGDAENHGPVSAERQKALDALVETARERVYESRGRIIDAYWLDRLRPLPPTTPGRLTRDMLDFFDAFEPRPHMPLMVPSGLGVIRYSGFDPGAPVINSTPISRRRRRRLRGRALGT